MNSTARQQVTNFATSYDHETETYSVEEWAGNVQVGTYEAGLDLVSASDMAMNLNFCIEDGEVVYATGFNG